MAVQIAYYILEVLNGRTEGNFCIFIFIKRIMLFEISLKVSGMLTIQVGAKLIDKPVFV